MGIPMVQVTDVSSDKLQVRNGFMGLAVLFADQTEVIPVIQDTQGLEYLLTSKIRKVTGTGRGKVGIVRGFGSPSVSGDMAQMTQVIREQYELDEVDLEQGEELPPDMDVVLVVDPTVPLSEWALSQLDGFLAGGGGLAVLAGGTDADLQGQTAVDLPDRFGGLLEDEGVPLGNDLVGDTRNIRITVAQRRGMFSFQNLVDFPYIPLMSDLSPDNPAVADLESVFLPFVSTVGVAPVEGIHYTELVKSSPESWRGRAPYDVRALIPEGERRIQARAGGPYTVAVAAEGMFASRYAGRSVTRPRPDGEATVEVAAPEPAPGRLLVVGSGDFMLDAYLMNGENVPFLMNGIDWLARDEALIALRSRGATDRPLEPVSDPTREAIKAADLLGGAALLVLVGLVRWRLRRGRRRRLEAMS